MNKREHFERWLKQIRPNLPLNFNDIYGFYFDCDVDLAYRAWLASPKTRPTEPSKISKEQLAELKADTSNIVNHLRGIYPGIADAYPVTPLMRKAADEIERLRKAADDLLEEIELYSHCGFGWNEIKESSDNLRAALNKKPAEAG